MVTVGDRRCCGATLETSFPTERVRPAAVEALGLHDPVDDENWNVQGIPVRDLTRRDPAGRPRSRHAVAGLELHLEHQARGSTVQEDLDLAVDAVVILNRSYDPLSRQCCFESSAGQPFQDMLAGAVWAHAARVWRSALTGGGSRSIYYRAGSAEITSAQGSRRSAL